MFSCCFVVTRQPVFVGRM